MLTETKRFFVKYFNPLDNEGIWRINVAFYLVTLFIFIEIARRT